MPTYINLFSIFFGIFSAVSFIFGKVIAAIKSTALMEHRMFTVEKNIDELKADQIRLEERIAEKLARIEAKLDEFILNYGK